MKLPMDLSAIQGSDPSVFQKAIDRWNGLAKPLGSLGWLEEAVARIAALTGDLRVCLDRRRLFIFCADNGVVARGVSQSDSSVTRAVAAALGAGHSTVCHMARTLSCPVIPVDVGMADGSDLPGVLARRVRAGTGDITLGPAMTEAECLKAMETGFSLAEDTVREGADLLLAGEMGIGNTTTSSAVLSVLLDRPPELLTGRGAGLSSDGLARKIEAVCMAIQVNRPDPNDPVDVLTKVGGLDLAALCGFYLGAARFRRPVLLDGFISCAAALCAARLCPAAADAMLATHRSAEEGASLALQALGLTPPLSAGLRLGEGSGAVAALPLLDMALRVYHSGNTFDAIGIEAYQPL